jgi:hypothetical protein
MLGEKLRPAAALRAAQASMLVEAVKEQQKQIAQQENQLVQQRNQIKNLKTLVCMDHPRAKVCK